MKKCFVFLFFLPLLFPSNSIKAQVTIGSGTAPRYFSILEVDASLTKGGIRFPQILTTERDTISVSGNTTTAPGLAIYNTTSKTLEFWDGTTWVSASPEPWLVSGTTATKATGNTQNIYQMGNVGIGLTTVPTNKLHVSATANPMRLEGLQAGVTADSLLTSDATGVVRRRGVRVLCVRI